MSRQILRPVRVNPVLRHPSEHRECLAGPWRFRLDPDDRGLEQRWYEQLDLLQDPISVPGCWQGQGYGSDGEDTPWDFRIGVRVFRATYKGTGWYGLPFDVPADWQGSRIWLNFGGVHPSAQVWLNGVLLGENDLPFVPFGFEVTDLVAHDQPNRLVVRVHEKHREFGFALNWQGNWSGLYRGVELTRTGASFIESCALYPDLDSETLRCKVGINGPGADLALRVTCHPIGSEAAALSLESDADEEVVLNVPSPRPWSPDTPNLYRVDVALVKGDEVLDAMSERVGFVKLSTEGKHFLINDEPHYMRGSGDFVSCPETGCADADRDRWRRKLQALRDYGYNYVRCQSYVYPPEYFDAADEVGLLIQSEMGTLGAWSGHSQWHVYQWPQPTPDNYPILKQQWDLIVHRDVSHPSANLYCMSNELSAEGHKTLYPRIAWQCYHDTKAIKPTAMVIWTDGGYNEDLPGDFVNDDGGKDEQCPKPLIQHEFRWWSSFPDVRAMGKYSGGIRPYGAELALEAASKWGLAHVLPEAAEMSQRLQFLEAKAKMEMCRRDLPRLAGICHFNAMDANLSPQGIIDEFYERKYADPSLWLETNGDTIVMSSLGLDDRVGTAGESVACKFFVSDFSHPALKAPTLEWRLVVGGEVAATGEVTYAHQPYCTCPAGEVEVTLPAVTCPRAARIEACLREGDRSVANRWDLWVLPEGSPLPEVRVYGTPQYSWLAGLSGAATVSAEALAGSGVVLTERLDARLVEFMRSGGRVILVATEGLVRPHRPNFGYVKYFFTPPANYPPYEDGQSGTIIREHPLLGDLPHEGFADLQFLRVIQNAPPIDLAGLGLHPGEPVVRVLHRYAVFRPLGYLLERRCGEGGLILCALDLDQSLPEARYLLGQMWSYATGSEFDPGDVLSDEAACRLIAATSLP